MEDNTDLRLIVSYNFLHGYEDKSHNSDLSVALFCFQYLQAVFMSSVLQSTQ